MAGVPAGMELDDDDDLFTTFGDDYIPDVAKTNNYNNVSDSEVFRENESYSPRGSGRGQLPTDRYSPRSLISTPRYRNTDSFAKSRGNLAAGDFNEAIAEFKHALMRGDLAAVKKAIETGVDVNEGLAADWTALMYAANYGYSHIVDYLLANGANPNYCKDMHTVLMVACASKSSDDDKLFECVKSLLRHGARVNDSDRHHNTPLILAAQEGRTKIIQLMLEQGANINKQDSRGWTALAKAASNGHVETVTLLLDSNADATKTTSDNQTAIEIATNRHRNEVVMLIAKKTGITEPSSELATAVESSEALSSFRGSMKSAGPALDDSSSTTSCARYGELEMFLCGLQLTNLIPLFQEQHISFENFLRMSDEDLQKIGVTQLGVRRKILDGIHAAHKQDWNPSSLVHLSKPVRCCEAVAMIDNLAKHASLMGSSVGFLATQLHHFPAVLEEASEHSNVNVLHETTIHALRNVRSLHAELAFLQKQLAKVSTDVQYQQADLILATPQRPRSKLKTFVTVSIAVAVVTIVTAPFHPFISKVTGRFSSKFL